MKTYYKYCVLVILGVLGLFHTAYNDAAAQEQGSILYVSPSRVQIAPEEKIQTLTVSNRSAVERRYDISVIDQIMNEQGVTQRVDTFDYSAKRMLRFVPKRFTLKPGERQIIRVMVRRPGDLTDGDYHSHMLFREIPVQNKSADDLLQGNSPNAASFEIKTLYGLAIPVVVEQGAVQSDMQMVDAQVLKNPNGPVLAIAMQRSGNAEASRYVTADKISASGERMPLMAGQWVRMYREVDQVNKMIEMRSPAVSSLSPGDQIEVRVSVAVQDQPELKVLQTKTLTY